MLLAHSLNNYGHEKSSVSRRQEHILGFRFSRKTILTICGMAINLLLVVRQRKINIHCDSLKKSSMFVLEFHCLAYAAVMQELHSSWHLFKQPSIYKPNSIFHIVELTQNDIHVLHETQAINF